MNLSLFRLLHRCNSYCIFITENKYKGGTAFFHSVNQCWLSNLTYQGRWIILFFLFIMWGVVSHQRFWLLDLTSNPQTHSHTHTPSNQRRTVYQTLYIIAHQTEPPDAGDRRRGVSRLFGLHTQEEHMVGNCLRNDGMTQEPRSLGIWGVERPLKKLNDTYRHLWKHIQSCVVGVQCTTIYTTALHTRKDRATIKELYEHIYSHYVSIWMSRH